MSGVRRVVWGTRPDGVEAIWSDGPPRRTVEIDSNPGFSSSVLWQTDPVPTVPFWGTDPTESPNSAELPRPGEARFIVTTQPPDAQLNAPDFDFDSYQAELRAKLPGFAEGITREHPQIPGHRVDVVQFGVVISGQIELELEDGSRTALNPGDCFITNGTHRGWRNTGDAPATTAHVLIGAQRV